MMILPIVTSLTEIKSGPEVEKAYFAYQEKIGKVRIELNGEVLYVRPDTYRILCDTYMPKESER